MLKNKEFLIIEKYLENAKRMEIREGREREIIIEKENGEKSILQIIGEKVIEKPFNSFTTIAEYYVRGKYGKNNYRGNCTGLIIKDFINQYKGKYKDPILFDPMVGSGTSKEVADEMGIRFVGRDLRYGYDFLKEDAPRSFDLSWIHPPYFSPEGSTMPRYSGSQWGNLAHESDGSHLKNAKEFFKWLTEIQYRTYQSLRNGGTMGFLIGPTKYKGKYYDPLVEMSIAGDIENVVIKRQFNCVSDSIKYFGKFIPIAHEYLIIIKKNSPKIIPIIVSKRQEISIYSSKNITWRSLISSIIEILGGKATKEQIYLEVQKCKKAENNKFLKEKIRQIINMHKDEFSVRGNTISLAA